MKIYFDGGCKPNPGLCECGVVIAGPPIERFRQIIGMGTNNIAEYTAFLWAVEIALQRGFHDVEIIGDSMLVVMQANGQWKVKSDDLKPFKNEFDKLRKKFINLKVVHVRREFNLAGHYLEKG